MKDSLTKLPSFLAAFSKSLLVAIKKQALEVARAFKNFFIFLARLVIRSAKRLWLVYCHVEIQILDVTVHLVLALFALRSFIVIVAIAVAFVYFKHWIAVIIYLLFLSLAALRHFSIDKDDKIKLEESHKKSHLTLVNIARWPLRVSTSVLTLYVSWHFIEGRTHSSSASIQASVNQSSHGSKKATPFPTVLAQQQPASAEINAYEIHLGKRYERTETEEQIYLIRSDSKEDGLPKHIIIPKSEEMKCKWQCNARFKSVGKKSANCKNGHLHEKYQVNSNSDMWNEYIVGQNDVRYLIQSNVPIHHWYRKISKKHPKQKQDEDIPNGVQIF